jgi:hypothetical protein
MTKTLPAPVGGWNTRDALAAMPEQDAQEMVNLFPTSSSVELRKGFSVQISVDYQPTGALVNTAQGFVKYGETSLFVVGKVVGLTRTLVENVVSAVEMSFAVTSSTPPSYVQFSNSAGNFVAAIFPSAGPTDVYYTFDGTTWVDRTATTTGSVDFRRVNAYQNQLWFTKNSTTDLNAYYLPKLAITGTPTAFPLGALATKGGYLFSISTWTLDGGTGGTDDLIVFLTSNGQAIVYQGIDPSSDASWRLVGVFDVSTPIGAPFKYGADLLLLLSDGLYSMTQILRGNTGTEFAVSDKIRTAWQAATGGASFSISGVTAAYSAKLNMIVVNFPTSAFVVTGPQTSQWFVMNTITKAWTKFTGLDAWAVDVMAGDIYFANVTSGGAGTCTVYKFGTATSDNSAAITGYARQAYSYLGVPGLQKCVTAILPSFTVTGSHTVGFAIDRDFRNEITTSTTPTNQTAYATGSYRPLLSYPVTGEALAVFAEISSSASACNWYMTTLAFVPGGIV